MLPFQKKNLVAILDKSLRGINIPVLVCTVVMCYENIYLCYRFDILDFIAFRVIPNAHETFLESINAKVTRTKPALRANLTFQILC